MTVVEELVSVLGLEIGEGALATLAKFRSAVTQGLAGVGGIVAALGAAFAGTVVSTAELGAEMLKVSNQIGISTDAVQELKYAADATNVSFESLTVGLKFLSKNAAEGGDASKRISEALGGVSMRNANGELKTADELLEAFADKIVSIKDPIEQVKVAMHGMHGQSGVEKMPLLKLGGAGIRKLREEARDLGAVLSKDTIVASDRFYKSLMKLKYAVMGVRNEVGTPFIDDFSDAIEWMTDRVRKARVWFMALTKTIRDLGQRFARIIEVGKQAFEIISKFITQMRLDKLADTVHWVELLEAALIGVATIAVIGAGATLASWLLAAAPFILIATLIGLIVDDIAHFVTGGDSVLGMADKWARRFDPKDAPEIKFFKALLALLFDLGDPAKWRRVGEAAIEGFMPLTEWAAKVRNIEPLKTIIDIVSGATTVGQKLSDGINRKIFGNGSDKSLFDPMAAPQPDFGSKPKDKAALEKYMQDHAFGNKPQDKDWRAKNLHDFGESPKDKAWREQQQHDAAIEDFRKSAQDRHAKNIEDFRQSITLHVHGANDPSDPEWAKKVQEIVDRANSDARAAISGGS